LKELVVISGKGGTGKTSIVASFSALAGDVVTADCDVDAADLHIIFSPKVVRRELFIGGGLATIIPDMCTGCGECEKVCRFDAISPLKNDQNADDSGVVLYVVDKFACDGCGVCAYFCPAKAINFEEQENGEWFVSKTRFGPFVHARLHAGAENSGKLVTVVKNEARRIADEEGYELVLVDGSPGIGCPVISSITGADYVLVVTEPTKSGLHDMERVLKLASFFKVRAMVAINKFDINEEMSALIEEKAIEAGVEVAGRIHYDSSVVEAQVKKKTVVEHSDGIASQDIKRIWNFIKYRLDKEAK